MIRLLATNRGSGGAHIITSLLSTFSHRYFDCKYQLEKSGWARERLWNDCIGTELYLMYLQAAGLFKIFSDSIESDQYGRPF